MKGVSKGPVSARKIVLSCQPPNIPSTTPLALPRNRRPFPTGSSSTKVVIQRCLREPPTLPYAPRRLNRLIVSPVISPSKPERGHDSVSDRLRAQVHVDCNVSP